MPDFLDYNIRNGRTYMYFQGKPLYAFGHGLSYTSFTYNSMQLSKKNLKKDDVIKVSVSVTNTGKRDGEEVVQLYVKTINSAIQQPIKALKSFQRVALKAGETKIVDLILEAKSLEYWNSNKQQFELEKGQIEIQVGGSSEAIFLTQKIVI
ncbi:Beta-glucosidase-like glycosyl hydrolase [Flavobacterium daejeonense]|nr:Beta-glucosidase-like glycosyl hydrolase [Flavobacterium daejeonense]